jgi:type I restriction enzyme S subunit
MERYEEYKPTGVEWLPRIPIAWESKKLKHCFKFSVGGTPTTSKESYFEGDNTWVTIADMHQRVITDSKTGLSAEGIVAADMVAVPKGSLMYSFKLSVGKVAFAGKDLYTNEAIFSVLPGAGYDLTYFYFALPELLTHSAGRNIYGAKIFNQELLKNAIIVLPPMEEQCTIVRFLDDKTAQVDQLITQKQQMLALLQEERAALINHAVTKGLDAAAPVRDSGIEWLDKIPTHWEVKRLKHLTVKIGSGVTPKGGAEVYQQSGVPILRSQNIHFDGLRLDDVAYIGEEVHDSMGNSKVFPGDVLLNITGASIGRCYFTDDTLGEANVNQHVCILRPNELISTKFLWAVLSAELGQEQIEISQNGSGREGLNFENLKKFVLGLPRIEEQHKIIGFLEVEGKRISELASTITQEITLLREYRAVLIAEAVTGQIDVRHYEPAPSLTAELVG